MLTRLLPDLGKNFPVYLVLLLIPVFFGNCTPSRQARLAHATSLLHEGKIDPAVQIYQSILEQHPYDLNAIEGMVRVAQQQGDQNNQVRWCRRLLQLRPWDRYANIIIGKEQLKTGNLKDAVVRFYMAYLDSDFKAEKREVLELLQQVHTQENLRLRKMMDQHK